MSEPFLGEIIMFGGNFAPRGWALCDGQLLSISSNTALFSILGTTYGGDGRTTFGLPDLRGRFPMHQGNGPGLPTYRLGEKSGQEKIQAPQHSHEFAVEAVNNQPGDETSPAGAVFPVSGGEAYYSGTPNATMRSSTTGASGGSTWPADGISVRNPFLAVNFIIALQGLFPSRN